MGHADSQDQKSRFKRMMGAGSPRLRSVVVAAGIIGVVAAPVGVAATGDTFKEGVRNGTATKETQIISSAKSTTAKTGGYATRQSNLSSTGGGAVYGCRTGTGGSAANPPQNPCVRANNLEQGYAFEFNATKGPVVGLITASGNGGDAVKPFVTNATGVATGLNADRVDGANAADIVNASTAAAAADATKKADAAKAGATDRWVTIGPAGTIIRQSGGFKLINCYQANGNCYIDAGSDVTNSAVSSEIVVTNGGNDAGTAGQLTGDIASSPCALTTVACAPAGAEAPNVFVVTPRNSDGSAVGSGPDGIAGNGDDVAEANYTFTATVNAAPNAP